IRRRDCRRLRRPVRASPRVHRTRQLRFRTLDRLRPRGHSRRLHRGCGGARRLGPARAVAGMAPLPRRLAAGGFRHAAHSGAPHAKAGNHRSSAVGPTDFSESHVVSRSRNNGLLRLDNVSKSFGGIRALSGVSLTIPENRIVGVIGPNGAGKTTLFNVITAAFRADTGSITFSGREISQWVSHRIIRAGIARTFQNIRLFAGMTVWEHLLVAQPRRLSPRSLLP